MKEELMPAALEWVGQKGFDKVKANYDGHENPKSWIRSKTEKPITPDITGVKHGKKNYVEVALKTEDTRRQVTKWKLLSLLASQQGGKFYLLAPRGHKAHTVKLVSKYGLAAEVISI